MKWEVFRSLPWAGQLEWDLLNLRCLWNAFPLSSIASRGMWSISRVHLYIGRHLPLHIYWQDQTQNSPLGYQPCFRNREASKMVHRNYSGAGTLSIIPRLSATFNMIHARSSAKDLLKFRLKIICELCFRLQQLLDLEYIGQKSKLLLIRNVHDAFFTFDSSTSEIPSCWPIFSYWVL